jgi:hypothetical protein
MMYPTNSREISFLSTAECRAIFTRLVRELDKLDEDGVFGPFGWRDRLQGPPPSAKSMSGEYRDQLAATAATTKELGGSSMVERLALDQKVVCSTHTLPATIETLDTTPTVVVT